MTKPAIDEILTQLYLRLNGYFTTGLILHSPTWGQNRTEIDCIAIRHPYHNQPDRIVDTSDFLSVNTGVIDLLFCEVKHKPELLGFNKKLKTDSEALRNALRWVGIFKEEEIDPVLERIIPLFKEDSSQEEVLNGIIQNNCRIRPLLSCPSLSEDNYDRWCLVGSEILSYFEKCLNPSEKRDSCSTRYNFQQWGYPFYQIIECIKNNEETEINDIYDRLIAT